MDQATVQTFGAPAIDAAVRYGIQALHIDYAHSLDDIQIDKWPRFFTDDGVYRLTTRENMQANLPIGIVHCIGRGMMEDRVKAFHTANIFEPHVYNHLIGPADIVPLTEGGFQVRSNFQVVRTMESGRMDLYAVGHYDDVVVVEGDSLLFKERVVVIDSRDVDILLVIPL